MGTRVDRHLSWGRAREAAFLSLRNASTDEQLRAYRKLEKKLLAEARTDRERLELQRRIATDLLRVSHTRGWRSFACYLRRMERLGYSDMEDRVLVCVLASQAAAGNRAGVQKTALMIDAIERRMRSPRLDSDRRLEFAHAVLRARTFAGLVAPAPAR